MAEPRFDAETLRQRLFAALAGLPDDQHLDALRAIDHGDLELILTAPTHVRVTLGGRFVVDIPVRDLMITE